jgi:hypothetical protein
MGADWDAIKLPAQLIESRLKCDAILERINYVCVLCYVERGVSLFFGAPEVYMSTVMCICRSVGRVYASEEERLERYGHWMQVGSGIETSQSSCTVVPLMHGTDSRHEKS